MQSKIMACECNVCLYFTNVYLCYKNVTRYIRYVDLALIKFSPKVSNRNVIQFHLTATKNSFIISFYSIEVCCKYCILFELNYSSYMAGPSDCRTSYASGINITCILLSLLLYII